MADTTITPLKLGAASSSSKWNGRDVLPFVLVAVAPLLYYKLSLVNLPVVTHDDERYHLTALLRLHTGTFNPAFFAYPSLYYYLTHMLIFWCRPDQILQFGRLVNLGFLGLVAFLTYLFCVQLLRSRTAGWLAAGMVICSPIVVKIGWVLRPDILFTCAVLAATICLSRYSVAPTRHNWFWAVFAVGLALGSKYTGLSIFYAYVALEMFDGLGSIPKEDRVQQRTITFLVAASGLTLIAFSYKFPLRWCLDFIQKYRLNPNVKTLDDYLAFFQRVRALLCKLGLALCAGALVIGVARRAYQMVSPRRIYCGLGLILLISVACTPFCLITPAKFLYDLGALSRSIFFAQRDHPGWGNYIPNAKPQYFDTYFRWAVSSESWMVLLLGTAGISVACWREWRTHRAALLCVVCYVTSIGLGHLGFIRYLAPALPFLFSYCAWSVVQLWKAGQTRRWLRIVCVVVAGFAVVQIGSHWKSVMEPKGFPNTMWNSYQVCARLRPARVYYAGYAPWQELAISGLTVQELAWASLGSGRLDAQLTCDDVLILDLDQAAQHSVSSRGDRSVEVLLDSPMLTSDSYEPQQVLRKANCSTRHSMSTNRSSWQGMGVRY
jgi:hypothetical protein